MARSTRDDLMAVVDQTSALPYVDRDRMVAAGGSYGGYMVDWLLGHTNRFKAAVTLRSVSNPLSRGMCMSNKTKCTGSRCTIVRASTPSPATSVRKPRRWNKPQSVSRKSRSSSVINSEGVSSNTPRPHDIWPHKRNAELRTGRIRFS